MEIPVWFWQNVVSGLFGAALLAGLVRAYNVMAKMFAAWREREREMDARAAVRMAEDIYRLVIVFGAVTLVIFSTLCGALGLALLVYHMTTPGASWLYYIPIGVLFGALMFCGRGLSLLNGASGHLNNAEAQRTQASAPEMSA